jgi:hypothetical protein
VFCALLHVRTNACDERAFSHEGANEYACVYGEKRRFHFDRRSA